LYETKEKKMSIEILAPMPGVIFQIHVNSGDKVQEGQELLVLEAMKMENPVVAPVSGNVKDLRVTEGDKVGTRQVLLVLE
jgi:biotin carboxyl carrier protein